MRWMLIAAVLLLASHVQAQERVYDNYSDAYLDAQDARKYLLVTLDYFYPVKADQRHVLCRLYGDKALSGHESLKDMQGAGVFVVDLTGGKNHTKVVSLLPLKHCSEAGVRELLRLPEGTLTQRTLIWAVRTHRERPQSTECTPGPELMAHAERHSRAMCEKWNPQRNQYGMQFHNLPRGIATSEIVAESWTWNRNVVDAALDLVKSWRGSPGHWHRLSSRHSRFGVDMKDNGQRWFGTGVFKD